MDAVSVLSRQIKRECERVRHTASALERADFSSGLTPEAAERVTTVRQRFLKALADLDAELQGLLPVKGSSVGAWRKLSEKREGVSVLVQESLALLQGTVIRRDPIESQVCNLADALLLELTSATGIERAQLTVLAGEESFMPRTQLIRLRFAESAPWGLPVMAHEFGHLIVQEHRALVGLWGSLPLQDLFEGKPDPQKRRELFSDLFAVYSIGPAYACTCLAMRFDPSKEAEEGADATHPSDVKRAYFILRALDRLRDADGDLIKPFGTMNEKLNEIWHNLRGPEALDERAAAELRDRLDAFWRKLAAQVSGARYGASRWSRAKRISDDFAAGKKAEQALAQGDAVIDVLNGVWRWRLYNWSSYEANSQLYDERALGLLRAAARL